MRCTCLQNNGGLSEVLNRKLVVPKDQTQSRMVLGIYLHDHETSNAGDDSHTEAVKLGARASTGASGAS